MITLNIEVTEEFEAKFRSKLEKDSVTKSQYVLKLLQNDLESRINLGEGFYYDKILCRLFNKKNEEIFLTKILKALLSTLLQYKGEIVPVDILMEGAWKRDNISIYTFRNMIRMIRSMTYYNIIKNHSSKGYSLDVNNS